MLVLTSLRQSFSPAIPASWYRRFTLLVAACNLLGACAKSDGTLPVTPPDLKVAVILINEGNVAIERTTHFTLTTTIRSTTGTIIDIPVIWRSSDERVATVDVKGRVTALDTGRTTLTATSLGVSSTPVVVLVYQTVYKIEPYQYAPVASNAPGATPDSLRVLVTNDKGIGVPGRKVVFSVTGGGGKLSRDTAVTNQLGIASTSWTLGPTLGINTVSAIVLNGEDVPITFIAPSSATFSLRTFDALIAVAGDNQSGLLLSALAVDPAVKVVDSSGKARPGIPVSFSVSSGGRVAATVVSTGADGVASPGKWTLGDTPGEQTLVASVENSTLVLKAKATGTPQYFTARTVTAGLYVSCAIGSDDVTSCWGEQPKVGDSTLINRSTPTRVKSDAKFSAIVAGANALTAHVCAISLERSAFCWGSQSLPDTAASPKLFSTISPVRYPSDLRFLQIAPAQVHNCALADDQSIYCWGDNSVGQLGDRKLEDKRYSPAPVFGGFRFTAVTAGNGHTCGLATDGGGFCWGYNASGQLGNGTLINATSPTAIGSGLVFRTLSAGDSFTCGLTTTNRPYCWGNLGVPGSSAVTTPRTYAAAPDFMSITTGGLHACALTSDGTAYCWGDNSAGQLGDSTTATRAAPTKVATSVRFTSLSAGYSHTCGVAQVGAVLCWGLNKAGELGDSTLALNAVRTQPRYIVLRVTAPGAPAASRR